MSDKTLTSDLTLDITAALKSVDRLDEAIIRATTGVRVTADARAVTAAIDAAVLNAGTAVDVTADAREVTADIDSAVAASDTAVEIVAEAGRVTGAIDAAVDNADTTVEVTAEAGRVTGAIDAAVDNADTRVDVEGSVDPELNTDVLNLVANLADAKDEAGGLGGILAGLSIGATAAGLFALADAASELEQSVGGTEAVFGDASDILDAFATSAAGAAGLTETAARTLTSQIGGLLKGFGFAKDEAALLSVQLAQLGADLAATFGGSPEEAVQALGAALRGEFNPLERFGIALNVAQINANAVAMGLATSTEEVGIAERAQSALAVILERSADAQGQFNRELDTAGGAMSVARAEAGNLAAEAGQHLTPALIELVTILAEEVGPDLSEVADQILPAVSEAIINLAPLLGITSDLLVAIAPAIELVATVLGLIPDEVVAVTAALVIGNFAITAAIGLFSGLGTAVAGFTAVASGSAVALGAAGFQAGILARGITGIATAVATANPVVVAGTVAIGVLAALWLRARGQARDFNKEVDELTERLEVQNGIARITTDALALYIEEETRLGNGNQEDDLRDLGLSFGQVATLAQQGKAGLDQFVAAAAAAGQIAAPIGEDASKELVEFNGYLYETKEIGGRVVAGNTDLVSSFVEIQKVANATAEGQLNLLVSQGLLTDSQIFWAIESDKSADATNNYSNALATLAPEIEAAQKAQTEAVTAGDALASTYLGLGDALTTLGENAPGVAAQLDAVMAASGPAAEREFLNLALAIDGAALSEEDMALAAISLGTDVETLTGFVEGATASLDDFVEAAVSELPSVADAFALIGDDETLGIGDFKANLDRMTGDLTLWHLNLQKLNAAGYADLAGTIAQQGPEIGGALAAEMAAAIGTANEATLVETQQSLVDFNTAWTDTTAYLRDTLGPEFILTTGLIGSAATASFGANLDFGERIRLANEVAALDMTESGKAVAVVAAVEGEDAAREYGKALQLDQETIDAAVAAGAVLSNDDAGLVGTAETYGDEIGESFGGGWLSGLGAYAERIKTGAAAVARAALGAAKTEADAHSPSRKFALLGADMGEGLALGIESQADNVAAQAAALVASAAASVAAETIPVNVALDSQLNDASRASISAASLAAEQTQVIVDVSMPVQFSGVPADAAEAETIGQALGGAVGDEAGRRLLRVLSRAAT